MMILLCWLRILISNGMSMNIFLLILADIPLISSYYGLCFCTQLNGAIFSRLILILAKGICLNVALY